MFNKLLGATSALALIMGAHAFGCENSNAAANATQTVRSAAATAEVIVDNQSKSAKSDSVPQPTTTAASSAQEKSYLRDDAAERAYRRVDNVSRRNTWQEYNYN